MRFAFGLAIALGLGFGFGFDFDFDVDFPDPFVGAARRFVPAIGRNFITSLALGCSVARPTLAFMTKALSIPLLGVTIAAAVGCAGRTPYSTAVPVLPVAEGVAAATVRYELRVGDASAGAVKVSGGTAEREARHDHVVRLTIGVENRTTDRRFVLPLGELVLRDGEGGRAWPDARLVEVDRRDPTAAVAVEPGQARAVTVAFALPRGTRVADLDRASLGWTLVIEDPAAREQPVRFARATALITNEAGRIYAPPPPGAEQNVAYSPSGMLPAAGQQRDVRPNPGGQPDLNTGTRGNQAMRATKEKPSVW